MYVVCYNDIVVHVQIIPVLYPRDEELVHATVSQVISTEEFGHYVDDSEVCEYGKYVKVDVSDVGVCISRNSL